MKILRITVDVVILSISGVLYGRHGGDGREEEEEKEEEQEEEEENEEEAEAPPLYM